MLGVLQILLGLVFLLVLPGYALVSALFPRRDILDNTERIGLGLAASVAVTASIAVLLNASPWGIQVGSVTASIGLFTFLTGLAAWYRLNRLPKEERFVSQFSNVAIEVSRSPLRIVSGFLLLVALVVVFGVGVYLATDPVPGEGLTQFYILGSSHKADDYPQNASSGQLLTLAIGVANYEHADIQYRIERVAPSGSEQVAAFSLTHQESWEQSYSFTLTQPGENQKVEFLLYRGDEQQPYRSLHLWITVTEEQ